EPLPILLVDDEAGYRDSVAQRLALRGFSPRTASSGEECMELLAREPAPVVILDVVLPGMDGIQTLRLIKAEHPDTEVVLITGHANTADGVRGIKEGGFDYLAKPVDIDHLAGKVRQANDTVLRREERRREARFREKMAQRMAEAERLSALGALAAGVAHEINNPLAIMIEEAGWMEDLLADDPCDKANLQEFSRSLAQIRQQGRRCKEITHNLLHFARKASSRTQEMNVNDMVLEIARLMDKRISDANVSLDTDLLPDLPDITASPTQMQQVLMNLINNALAALENRGGRILVSTSLAEHPQAGSCVLLQVEDDGPGIPEEYRKRIFEPFFTTKPVGKGVGLGLSICYGIVTKMGGDIEVQSASGKGAAFRVFLPLDSRPDAKSGQTP
ncbi:MAG: ATP-binding protein, partial [Desulfovibrionaceae bacterium]